MAGPTPVSALIHAATMVTAGVYLVARCNLLFAMAPVSGAVVAGVGALTALFAATIALKQWDIKRVLAYSTISQLGYMFVAVGTGGGGNQRRHLPPRDARVLQGAAVSRIGQWDLCDAPRLPRVPLARGRPGHAQHGWTRALHAMDDDTDVDRDAGDRRRAAAVGILLEGG